MTQSANSVWRVRVEVRMPFSLASRFSKARPVKSRLRKDSAMQGVRSWTNYLRSKISASIIIANRGGSKKLNLRKENPLSGVVYDTKCSRRHSANWSPPFGMLRRSSRSKDDVERCARVRERTNAGGKMPFSNARLLMHDSIHDGRRCEIHDLRCIYLTVEACSRFFHTHIWQGLHKLIPIRLLSRKSGRPASIDTA